MASNVSQQLNDTPRMTREFALYDLDRNALTFYRQLKIEEWVRKPWYVNDVFPGRLSGSSNQAAKAQIFCVLDDHCLVALEFRADCKT